MADPKARIYILDDDGMGEIAHGQTGPNRVKRDFLTKREACPTSSWKTGAFPAFAESVQPAPPSGDPRNRRT